MAGQVDLFAVQPRVTAEEYLTVDAFAAHHRALAARVDGLRERDAAGNPVRPALAVWPEYVGTFLALLGAGRVVRGCRTTQAALTRVALRHLPGLVTTMARHRTRAVEPALLTLLAPTVQRAYVDTFGGIARDFDLWVVAGSLLLPRNRYGDGARELAPLPGPHGARVYNTSYTFDPSGRCIAVTRKVNLVPTQEDVLHLAAGDAADLPVVDTPFGRLGTLVCYDGFAEPHTSPAREPGFVRCGPVLDALGAQVVAQPSANAWAWDEPWVFNAPGEHLLRRDQWFAEGFAHELAGLTSVRYAVNAQLVGQVLDNVFEAPSLVLAREPDGVRVLARAADPRGEDVLHVRVDVPG